MTPHLHIIALDNPFPPDYGGAIDMYYKIQSLARLQTRIHLHLFQYGRHHLGDLPSLTESLHVYPRHKFPWQLLSGLPFIVKTRQSNRLIRNIRRHPAPVLFEGIHTTGILPGLELREPPLIRIHNVESDYYAYLAQTETNPLRKWFFRTESRKLARYEPETWRRGINLYLHPADRKKIAPYGRAEFVPVFHPFRRVEISAEPAQKFVLFHGNLSVAENRKAVRFLWNRVVRPLGFHMVVAGKNPSRDLVEMARKYPRLGLVANPSDMQMERLIRQAQVHLIWSDNPVGMKLKILYALFRGKHILVSETLMRETCLQALVHTATDEKDWRDKLRFLYREPIQTERIVAAREEILSDKYDNPKNARKILEYVR